MLDCALIGGSPTGSNASQLIVAAANGNKAGMVVHDLINEDFRLYGVSIVNSKSNGRQK